MKKRNFFKTLSSAALGALTIGSCSNVWMMEDKRPSAATLPILGTLAFGYNFNTKIKNALAQKIAGAIIEKGNKNENSVNFLSKKLADKVTESINPTSIDEERADLIADLATEEQFMLSYQLGSPNINKIAQYIVSKYNS